jgi:hypothetical protein
VYTACVQALTDVGLMVIPNCHLLFEGFTSDPVRCQRLLDALAR